MTRRFAWKKERIGRFVSISVDGYPASLHRVSSSAAKIVSCSRVVTRPARFARATIRDAFEGSKRALDGGGEGEKSRDMPVDMDALSSISGHELRARLSAAVGAERSACANVIAHLAELDRRQLYLDDACSSLLSYCTERLGYSEDSATKRMRVARLVQRIPRVLDELASGRIHLTGLFLLARYLTEENAEQLLGEARGKSKRQIEELLAKWFPRPDVLPSITPLGSDSAWEAGATCSGASGNAPVAAAPPAPASRHRVEPLSATSYRIEFTASAALRDKLEHARNLLSHAVPSRDIAQIIERALDQLIAVETKRRSGAARPRKRRETKPSSRHVPVEVQRAVRERDAERCTFTDAEGRRCSEKRFLTIEHIEPFARGGPTTVDNCCLLCKAHNAHRARQAFGKEHIRRKIAQSRARRDTNRKPPVSPPPVSPVTPVLDTPGAQREPDVYENVAVGLVKMGFARPAARRAVEQVRSLGVARRPEPVLRAALAVLTP